ncbi:MAG: metal ABC transporter substrate-binding protein, partial [Bdellovibrionota bacterium]
MRAVFLLFLMSLTAEAKVSVITTTADLAALAAKVGGNEISVSSIAKGTQDPHEIEAKPSFMVQMRNANLVVAQGLELETAWIVPLIKGARNPAVNPGGKGFLELGGDLDPIEKPTGAVSRAEGDVHPGGNPHFQVDPIRMGKAAQLLADRLAELDVAHADAYHANANAFQKHLEEKTKDWQARLAKTGIKDVVTYHKTLSYFFDRFGIKNSFQLEP